LLCRRERFSLAAMQTITHNPTDGIYAATPDYVHALEIRDPRRLLFVAGTMGLDATGTPPPSFEEQLELVWSNIRAILGAAGMTVDDIVRATSYLRDARNADANGAARLAALGGRAIPTTAIVVETLASDWLVEIEVVAAA
jgi:2-iminobutanoate/2-iminopropanoate deaminase